MRCPRCADALREVHRDPLHLDVCVGCGGVWLEGVTLSVFASALRRQPGAVAAAQAASAQALCTFVPDPDRIGCPRCRATMEITQHPSGVALDVCRHHGVWFDRDELERVVHEPGGAATATAARAHVAVPSDSMAEGMWALGELAVHGGDLIELVGDVASGAVGLVFGVLEAFSD